MPEKQILILGVGNPILSDDAIGWRLVEALQTRFLDEKAVDFMTVSVGGMEILDIICEYKKAIIVDAITRPHEKIGEIERFTFSDFKETLHLNNPHDMNFATALELARMLGRDIPESIVVFAVNVSDVSTFSEKMTLPMEAKFSKIVMKLERFLKDELCMKPE